MQIRIFISCFSSFQSHMILQKALFHKPVLMKKTAYAGYVCFEAGMLV